MPNVNPLASQKIDAYFVALPNFSKKICTQLRQIILKTIPGVVEDWKWGPNYQYPAGTMIFGLGAFKGWVKLTFFNGAPMKDKHKLFNDGENSAHNRSIKFAHVKEINQKALVAYLKEAIKIPSQPLKKSTPTLALSLPKNLEEALKKHKLLKVFKQLTYTERKEHIQSIDAAQKPETKKNRILKIIFLLQQAKV